MIDLLSSTLTADYQVIMASESWLNHTINSLEFMSTRYIIYRKDRESSAIPTRGGGGVFIAVRSNIRAEEYVNDQMRDLEAICVKISSSSGNIYIYCIYIQYGSNIDVYRSHMGAIKTLRSILMDNDSLIICGDFNMNGITWNENDLGFDFIPAIGDSQSISANL